MYTMADEEYLQTFRENPDLFRLHMLNSFKECIADIKMLMKGTALEENGLPEHMETMFTNNISGLLDQVFKSYDLAPLVKEIKKLEENSPKEPTWKPITGEVDLSVEKKCALLERKKLLQSAIKEQNSKINQLKEIITNKRNDLKIHLVDLQKCMEEINQVDKQR